jgi:hypothetical protein
MKRLSRLKEVFPTRARSLIKALSTEDVKSLVGRMAVLNSLKEFSAVLHDLDHFVCRRRVDFDALTTIPDRYTVMREIAACVPQLEDLATTIPALLHTIQEDEHICCICTSSWDEVLASLPTKTVQVGPLMVFSSNMKPMVVSPAYEGVPIRMPCGHVFCTSCIERWIGSETATNCPYRDQHYGIHRPHVWAVEKLRQEFGFSNG